MRDYKGSGGMSLRRRKRTPWGSIFLVIIILAAGVAGYLVWERTDLLDSASAIAKPEREQGVIPLTIPGQQPSAEQNTAD